MQQKNINRMVQWWQTTEFPLIHLKDKTNFVKKWFFHPIKRRLARWYLKFLQKFTDITVIAITGSAGKTTTKEMLASILKIKGKTIYTKENIDPIYNIPTTILKTPFGTKYLILEMGVEYPNEMDFYLWLAKPEVGVITNVFPTHTEYLGGIDGVLKEKSKLVISLDKDDIAVLGSKDSLLKSIENKIKAKVLWAEKGKDLLVQDAYVASLIADALGIGIEDIKKGISNFKKPPHRMNIFKLKSGAVLFDDTYNSNPQAVLSSLDFFIKRSGDDNKIAVLGDMLELGSLEESMHRKVGKEVAKHNFQAVIGVGKASKYIIDEIKKNNKYTKTYLVDSYDKVLPLLEQFLYNGSSVFMKGSHSIGLDKVASSLS